ncbi:galectin-3 isoform 1-T1 [Mantella aurantiaca]
MADFDLDDALSGQSSAGGQQTQSQGQNWNNPWGAPPAGQQYPGAPPAGQYPGAPPAGQYPGAPPAGQYPGFPAGGQQYQGGFPGYPGFPAPGQQYPGVPMPGQPTDPKMAGQSGPFPSAPTGPTAPTGPLKLPYTLPLPSGIMPGLVLTLQGVINPNAKRWNIDIRAMDDIVFHFNPRFDENPNVIVRNSMFQGRWGAEERPAPKFPFQKGQQFMVQIFCEPEQYRVVVNNENLLQYKHRNRNFQQTKAVQICGDITLNGATATMM